MTYTKIPKPTSTTYTNVNPLGKQSYDESDIIYDSTTVFYDGVNVNAYTKVAKPATSSYTKVAKPS